MAFFEVHVSEGHDWNRLFVEITRDRKKALKAWRQKGREILARARAQREAGPDMRNRSALADEFAVPGTGIRSLKRVRRG